MLNYIKFLCIIFILNCFKSSPKYSNTPIFYPTDARHSILLLQLFNKNWILFFFSHLLTLINPTIYCDATFQTLILHLVLLKCFTFNMSSQKSDKSYSIRIIFIKIIININIINIYIKNPHFIIIKYNITKIFIKIDQIFVSTQNSKKI